MIRKKSIIEAFLLMALPMLLLLSCNKYAVFDKNSKIDTVWEKDELLYFNVDINDSLKNHDILINVRNKTDYQYSNLILFIGTTFPNGFTVKDTVEIFLSDIHGKWLGKGIGENKDLQVIYRKFVRFPLKGNYKFSIQHAMRKEKLNGINNIGIRIERTE